MAYADSVPLTFADSGTSVVIVEHDLNVIWNLCDEVLFMAEGSVDQIRAQALADGMLTLRMDGMKKIEKGVTTLEEVVKETAA